MTWLRGKRQIPILVGLILCAPVLSLVGTEFQAPATVVWGLFDRPARLRFLHSLELGAATVVFSALLAAPVYALHLGLPSRWRPWLAAASLLPFSYPPFATASAWMTLAAELEGSVSTRILWGPAGPWSSWLYSLPGAAWILALNYWPVFYCFLCVAGRLGTNPIDAGQIYLRPAARWFRITLPAWRAPLAGAAALVAALAMKQFETPSLLQQDVYPLEIYTRFASLMQTREALLLSLPYALALAGLAAAIHVSLRNPAVEGGKENRWIPPRLPALLIMSCVAVVFLLSAVVPVAALCWHAGSVWNVAVVGGEHTGRILRSLAICIAGAVCIVLPGWLLTRGRARESCLQAPWLLLFLLTLPGILIAAGVLQLRSFWPGRLPAPAAWISLLYAYGCQYAVLGYLAGRLTWQAYGLRPSEIDRIMGLRAWTRIRWLYLPSQGVALAQAMAVIGLLLWSDVAITVLLYPPGGDTLCLEYFNLLHYGSESRTAVVGLLLFCIPALAFALAYGTFRQVRSRIPEREG